MTHELPTTRRILLHMALVGALGAATGMAHAQINASSKPIRLIVGGPPGGAVDLTARMLTERLSGELGHPILVENKPGASGLIGMQELMKSPRDGYTFLVGTKGLLSELPHFMKLPFDPFKELRPLADLSHIGLVLVVNNQIPANDLSSFVSYVQENKGKVSFASYLPGSISHTLGIQLNKLAGLDMLHIGYKGTPPALQDLIAGNVQAMFAPEGSVLPHIKSGRLKAFATTLPRRSVLMPNTPTFAELDYKSLTEVTWTAIWTTPDVSEAIQAKVRDATLKALQDSKVRDSLAAQGYTPGSGDTPDELLAAAHRDSEKQAAMLQAIGFKPE